MRILTNAQQTLLNTRPPWILGHYREQYSRETSIIRSPCNDHAECKIFKTHRFGFIHQVSSDQERKENKRRK